MSIFVPSVALPDGSRQSVVPTIPVDQEGAYTPVPDVLVSGGGLDGTNPRLRVDVGEPSFFDGRQFRTFHEFNMILAAVQVIKIVVPVNVILYGLVVAIATGEIRVETVAAGTEGGSFATPLPIFPRNTMTERPTPLYVPLVTMTTGGTLAGGTLLDALIVKTAGNTNFSSSVGAAVGDERGVGPGTYYFRLTAVEATRGILRARWEERLP
jgi:hypothetical protein